MRVLRTDNNWSFANQEGENNSKKIIRCDGRMPRRVDLELGLSTGGAGGRENEFSEALQSTSS